MSFVLQKNLLLSFVFLVFAHCLSAETVSRWVHVGEVDYELKTSTPYHIKLYLPYGAKDIGDLKEYLYPMRFEITWLEPVSADSVKLLFKRQIRNHFPDKEALRLYKHYIRFFTKKLKATKADDVWVFEYFPDEGIRLFINDKLVHLMIGVELNRALLRSWMEFHPIMTSKLINKLLRIQP